MSLALCKESAPDIDGEASDHQKKLLIMRQDVVSKWQHQKGGDVAYAHDGNAAFDALFVVETNQACHHQWPSDHNNGCQSEDKSGLCEKCQKNQRKHGDECHHEAQIGLHAFELCPFVVEHAGLAHPSIP